MVLNYDKTMAELADLEQICNMPCSAGVVDPVPVTQQAPTLPDEPLGLPIVANIDPPCVMAATNASGYVQMKPSSKADYPDRTPEPPEPPEQSLPLPGLTGKARSRAESVPSSSTTLFQVPSTPLQARHASSLAARPVKIKPWTREITLGPSSKTAAPSVPVPPWRGGEPPLVPEQPTHPPPGHVLAPAPPLHPPPPPAPRTMVYRQHPGAPPPLHVPLQKKQKEAAAERLLQRQLEFKATAARIEAERTGATSERVSVPMAGSLPTPPPPPSAPVSVPKVSSSSNDGQAKGGGKAKGRWPGERGGKRKHWQSALGLARLDGREAEKAFMAKHPRPENREEDEAFARR